MFAVVVCIAVFGMGFGRLPIHSFNECAMIGGAVQITPYEYLVGCNETDDGGFEYALVLAWDVNEYIAVWQLNQREADAYLRCAYYGSCEEYKELGGK
jgi:hypothetical protein